MDILFRAGLFWLYFQALNAGYQIGHLCGLNELPALLMGGLMLAGVNIVANGIDIAGKAVKYLTRRR